MNNDNILEVKDLHVDIHMTEGLLTAVRGVNFEIKKGETLGLVGESGCGKSLTSKAILAINDKKCTATGEILFRDENDDVVDIVTLERPASAGNSSASARPSPAKRTRRRPSAACVPSAVSRFR